LLPTYFDYDALMHHALHVQDFPGKERSLRYSTGASSRPTCIAWCI